MLKIQSKLHRWALDDSHRRFDDLFNLVADPEFPAGGLIPDGGVHGRSPDRDRRAHRTWAVAAEQGAEEFIDQLRAQPRDRSFHPVPVREWMIPKTGGKLRRLGIPTVADPVV